ncbi:MAG: cell division protein FtsZ, partial [Clostridia bacterium]|nr:cell division protein FtsZ [Clostridia bacterium]
LIETPMNGAKGVIISITGSPDMGLDEMYEASSIISEAAHPDANIIWGANTDESLEDTIKITVIATGAGDTVKTQKADDPFAALNINSGNDTDDTYFDVSKIFPKV